MTRRCRSTAIANGAQPAKGRVDCQAGAPTRPASLAAFQLYLDGVPLNDIRRQLRHASLASTQVYIDHLAPADSTARVMAARPDWTAAS